ncbi:MAG: hypothetical protein P0Y60_14475 [Candidatus Microbacterium colombiense]|nr:MAG: hypothetical protein P0Y60_14475 [Microbacterium sp.]
MTADEQGNDLGAVGVPITGMAAFAQLDAENVLTKTELCAKPLVLPPAYRKLGLYKVDGGPAPGRETEDPILFFQVGYSLAGDGTRSVVITLAEQNANVQHLIEGAEPDENGVIEVSASLPDNRFILVVVTKYRGGLEKRQIGVASVTAVELDQQERGSVEGAAVTFTWAEHDLFNGAPFWQYGPAVPGTPPAPTGATAGTPGAFTPSGATVPANITALRALGDLGQTTAWTTGQYIVIGTGQVSWDGTDWKTGAAA